MNFRRIRLPHAITLLLMLTGFVTLLTHIIPAGTYQHILREGRDTVVAGTYQLTETSPQGLFAFFNAPFKGLVEAADIIAFVLLIGGCFGVLEKTGSLNAIFQMAANRFSRHGIWFIPLSMLLFSSGGTLYGMCEETIPFYLIYIPLMTRLGYDVLTGVAVVFLGAGIGVAASTLNPFATGIAQALAGLAPASGLAPRIIAWLLMTTCASLYVMQHAMRFRRTNLASDVSLTASTGINLELKHIAVLAVFFCGLGIMVCGVMKWGWYIPEISAIFVIIAVSATLFGRINEHDAAEAFIHGASGLLGTAILIGLSRGILVVARDGRILDTILHAAASTLSDLPHSLILSGMLALQSLIAFWIPSSSSHASLTVPILAPLSDLAGFSRQQVVTAFQFGNGLANLITPTSGLLMGALAIGKISWGQWLKFILPLLIVLFTLANLMLLLTSA